MSDQLPLQPPVEVFIQQDAHLWHRKRMLAGFLQKRDDLLPTNARKSLEKLLNRVPRFEVIKQGFHWHARARKDEFPTEDARISGDDSAHERKITIRRHKATGKAPNVARVQSVLLRRIEINSIYAAVM